MSIIAFLRNELQAISDEKGKISSQHFFKESMAVYGVKAFDVKKISKKYLVHIKKYSKEELWKLCEELWKSQYLEECMIACHWSESRKKEFSINDFDIFERWIQQYVSNWATCDTFCNHTVGEFVMKFPEYIYHLKKWTKSNNRWVKRAAAVSLIIPARKGLFLSDIIEIAESLLLDEDDIVQKGYGWMLKAASQYYPKEIFDYVISRKKIMPRTAYRYALEKMPNEWRDEAMKK